MSETIVNKFFELIRITLGNQSAFETMPSEKEWQQLFSISNMQSLSSLLLTGMERALSVADNKPSVFYEWIATRINTEAQNALQNKRAKELYELLRENGFQPCLLKGQGTALYYEHPEARPCGDIDMWVGKNGDCGTDDIRDEVLRFAKFNNFHIGNIDIKHSDIEFFQDVPVEIHFLPSWMYNPSSNRKLQMFFSELFNQQSENYDDNVGFAHTTVDFDLVFSIVHIYRHIFSEGIGLRQVIDYYFILQNSSEKQRADAYAILELLKVSSFVGGVMWILVECLGMKKEFLMCPVNEKHGNFLLNEIMTGGNFGHFDNRRTERGNKGKFEYGLIQFNKNLRFVSYYPSEVLWSPFWKTWHFFWRKRHGYL